MIVFLPLVYAYLSSGGYLNNIGSVQDYLQSFQNGNGTIPTSESLVSPVSDSLQGYWDNLNIRNIIQNTIQNYQNEDVKEVSERKDTSDRIQEYITYFGDVINKFQNKEQTTQPPKLQQTAKALVNVHKTVNPNRVPRFRHFNTEITTRHPFKTKGRSRGRGSYTLKEYPITRTQAITRSPINATLEIENATDNVLERNNETRSSNKHLPDIIPSQATHVTKYVETCPDEGYFFKKDLQSNATGACYLCFCKENSTEADCFIRDCKKCNAEMHIQKKRAKKRIRRSPVNFGELVFGNFARDTLAKNERPQECKTSEASFSEGCPPDDWCVGCTVCDCNAHGKWDCHLLSFCSDDDAKRKRAKQATEPGQPGYDPFKNRKSQKVERDRKKQVVQQLAEKMAQARQKKKIGKSNSKRFFFKNGTLVNRTIFDTRKRVKSPSFLNLSSEEVGRWSEYNLKLRKIPNQIQKQEMMDRQLNNAKKVSEVANFQVRNMLNLKQRKKLDKKNAQDVAKLAQRQPAKKKKKRNIVLPPGLKIPKELLDKLPPGLIPTRAPPGANYPENFAIQRTLPNQIAAEKPAREMLHDKKIKKRSVPLPRKPKMLKKPQKKGNDTKKNMKSNKESRKHGAPTKLPLSMLKETTKSMPKITRSPKKLVELKQKKVRDKIEHFKKNRNINKNAVLKNKNITKTGPSRSGKNSGGVGKTDFKSKPKTNQTGISNKNRSKSILRKNEPKKNVALPQDKNRKKIVTKTKDIKLINKRSNNNYNKSKSTPSMKTNQSKNKGGKATKTPPAKPSKNGSVIKTKESSKKSINQSENKKSKLNQNKVPSRVKKSINQNSNAMKVNPKIDQTRLNEEVTKLTQNIETNLKRKVFLAVEQIIGRQLKDKGKRKKRSVDFEQSVAFNDVHTNNSLQDFPAHDSSKVTMNKSFSDRLALNKGFPESTKSEMTIVKRSPQVNQKQVNAEIQKITKNIHVNLRRKIIEAVEGAIHQPITEKTKTKRSAHFLKKVVLKKKSKQSNSKLLEIPIKKSQKINVSKSNKVKLQRHRRSVKNNESTNEKITLGDIEQEISSNRMQDIPNIITTNLRAPNQEMNYYNYNIDKGDKINQNPEPKEKHYLTDAVRAYSKKSAAKRSVDSQIDNSNSLSVLEIVPSNTNDTYSVRGLKEQKIELSASKPSIIKSNVNLTIGTDDMIVSDLKVSNDNGRATIVPHGEDELIEKSDEYKVNAVKINTVQPLNVLDDKVVIIEDQNISSVEGLDRLNDIRVGSKPSPTITTYTHDLESIGLINSSVIGIKKDTNTSAEKSSTFEDLNASTKVDKTVVIVKDQIDNHVPAPKMTTDLELTTEPYIDAKVQKTVIGINGKPSSVNNAENPKPSKLEETESPATIKVLNDNSNERSTVDPTFFETKSKEADENFEIIRETVKTAKTTEDLKEKTNNKYLLKLTTENYFKSQYNIDENVSKQEHEENKIKDNQRLLNAIEKTTEQLKDSSPHPKLNQTDSFNYTVLQKVPNLIQSSTTPKILNEKIIHQKIQINNSSVTEKDLKEKDLHNNSTQIQNSTSPNSEDIPTIIGRIDSTTMKEPGVDDLPLNNTEYIESTTKSEFKSSFKIGDTEIQNIIKENKRNDSEKVLKINEQNHTTLITDHAYKNAESSALPEYKVMDSENQIQLHKNKVTTHDIKKISMKKAKKLKVKKILNTLYNKTKNGDKLFTKDDKKSQKQGNKTNDMKSFFKKLLNGFKFRKGAHKPSKVKRFKILKYLQKFFKKVFAADGKHKKNKTITPKLNRKSVIETLCSTFGPCNININNKAKLQYQIDHLNTETYKMLRSVKIIKGLLKLVDLAKSDKVFDKNFTRSKPNFKNDVQKLHAILRDTYTQEEHLDALSETQKIQIEYIKNNTQNFIESAAKFTMVLNDIIDIITVPNKMSEMTTKNKLKSSITQAKPTNKTINNPNDALEKLKELISKYSLVQNTFMRKIYNVLTHLDSKDSKRIKNSFKDPKMGTNTTVQNKTEEIQVYTKNIIQNLRKLKNLAQSLNGNVRRKRDARSDDSIEYMLMLMEYLLQQNNQLDVAPASDGIDLLLEAIKNAPDIKTIKKKVLPFHTFSKPPKARNATALSRQAKSNTSNREESSSDSESKTSKEDCNSTSATLEETNLNAIDQNSDDDDDREEFPFNRRMVGVAGGYLSTTGSSITTLETSTKYAQLDLALASSDEDDVKPNLVINSNDIEVNDTKLDIFEKEVEDTDNQPSSTTVTTDYESTSDLTESSSTTVATESTLGTTVHNSVAKRMNSFRKDDEDVSSSKSRLDWIDETYEEEIKADLKSSTPPPCSEGTQYINGTCEVIPIVSRRATDDSGVSKEDRKQKKILHKKEMDLLNSLDYANEKKDSSSSESKESSSVDKYSGDMFFFTDDKLM